MTPPMPNREFEFQWDERKAESNEQKHGVPFVLASSIFSDPLILTVPDEAHSEAEERWFSIGRAIDGSTLSVAYVWAAGGPPAQIRLITARRATKREIRYYQEGA